MPSQQQRERYNCVAASYIDASNPMEGNWFICCHHGFDLVKMTPLVQQEIYKRFGEKIDDMEKIHICTVCGLKHRFVKNTSFSYTTIHIDEI